jgi:diaminopimelate epimerase
MIRFTKMHGLGNDYVYVDCYKQNLDGVDLPALARAVSDRHCGVGSDGLILIRPPSPGTAADVCMEMYNADGSRAEMCGNGIRCVAKYALEHRLVNPSIDPAEGGWATCELRIATDRGVLVVQALLRNGFVDNVRVNMGPPILEPARIPVAIADERCLRHPIEVEGQTYHATCVSMGNPHAVIYVDDLDAVDLARVGPLLERHPLFPNRVNVHAAAVRSPWELAMRSWERGAGLTLACGTGACAVLVAGVLEERLERRATLHLPGGALEIEWTRSADGVSGDVLMTGPAVEVFSGEWPT